MKSKLIALLCAAMLSMCCIGLAACGGGSTGSASGSGAASEAADPTAKFIGEWQMAGAQLEGLTIAGDFSGMFGQDVNFTMAIAEDGTGTATFNDQSSDFTWEAAGDDAITISSGAADAEASDSAESASAESASAESASAESASAESASAEAATAEGDDEIGGLIGALGGDKEVKTIEVKYENDMLVIEQTVEQGNMRILFTADGTMADMPEIKADALTDFTSEDALIGEWSLTGVNMMGATMYGDMSALAEQMGNASAEDMKIVIEEGGKATFMGQEIEWSLGDNGAVLSEGGQEIPMKALDDGLAIDMGSLMGGLEMILVFSK